MTTNAKDDDDDDDESIPTTVAAAVAADTSEQVVVLHPATTTTTTTPSISYENTTRKTCESSSSPSLVANHTNNENHTQTNTISTTATTPILPLPTTTTNTAVVDVALAKAEKRAWEFEQEQNRSKVVATEDAVTLIDKATEDAVALAAMQEAATIVMEAEQNLKKRKAATNTESSLSSSPNHKKQRSPPTKQRSPPTRVPWEDRLLQLQDYKTQHGNLLIPIRYKLNPSLGKFVHNTREQYKLFHKQTPEGYKKKCSLTAERIQQLDDMGFAWTTQRKHKQTLDWQSRLQQLQAFKEKCGHCLVPHGYTPDPSFAEWIHRQRTTYATMLKDSKPNPVVKERMEQLEAMGFNFTVHSDKWTDHWNQLKEYKDKHGDCQVPTHYTENPKLGRWVHTQRHHRRLQAKGKKACITEERIDLLDQLGFSWEVRPSLERPRASWYQRLEELTLFQQKYEHFQVDPKYMPELHAWSHEQRQRLRHHHTGKDVSKKLSEERVKELHAIGFTKDVPLNETKSTAKPPPDATEVSLKKVAGNIKQPVIPVGGAKTVDGNHETTVDIEKAPHMIQI